MVETEEQKEWQSKQRQLTELYENLRLIEEQKAKYVLEVDVPIQLIKDERRLRERIAQLEADIAALPAKSVLSAASLLRATPPAPPAHFTGRAADLAKFAQLLTSGASVAMTALHGMGGIGKTSLAQKLAEQIAVQFPGGVLWWTLGPDPNVNSALNAWGQLADEGFDPGKYPSIEQLIARVRTVLARLGKMCVIIDDVWGAKSARVLLEALPPDSAILITTRNAQVAGALGCHVERIGRLAPAECLEFLAKLYAPQSLSAYESAAEDIIKIVDRLPLALRLIRGLADTPARLPRLVEKLHRKPLLDILKLPDDEGREASLEWCLALSYTERLNADMQRRFCALGAFARAPYDRAAIAAVWDETDEDTVVDSIEYLIQRNLLEEDEATQAYSQHALLHAYALALLEKENEHNFAAARHAIYYRSLAKTQDWRAVEHAFDQIEHGWQWVQANTPEQIIDYVWAVNEFLRLRGRQSERLNYLTIGLSQARVTQNRKSEGGLLNSIGYLYYTLQELDQALDYLQTALAIQQEVNDPFSMGSTLNNLGNVYRTQNRTDKALDFYQQALAVRREIGDRRGEGVTFNNLGMIYRKLNQGEMALGFYEQALSILREVGDRSMEGAVLNNLGVVNGLMGRNEQSFDYYRQALLVLREAGDRWSESTLLGNISAILERMNRIAEAISYLEQCVALMKSLDHPDLERNQAALNRVRAKLRNR